MYTEAGKTPKADASMIVRSISLLILMSTIVVGLDAAVEPNAKPRKAGGPMLEQMEDLPDPLPPAKPPKDAEKRFQWNKMTSLGDYERAGERNAKWDEPAKKALELFARLRAYGMSAVPDKAKAATGWISGFNAPWNLIRAITRPAGKRHTILNPNGTVRLRTCSISAGNA